MTSMSVSEARAALPRLLDRVLAGEEVTITRNGKAAAVLVRPDSLRSRRADAALATASVMSDLLAKGRRSSLRSAKGISAKRANDLIAEVRAARKR